MGGGTATGQLPLEPGIYFVGNPIEFYGRKNIIRELNKETNLITFDNGFSYPTIYFENARLAQKDDDLALLVEGEK